MKTLRGGQKCNDDAAGCARGKQSAPCAAGVLGARASISLPRVRRYSFGKLREVGPKSRGACL